MDNSTLFHSANDFASITVSSLYPVIVGAVFLAVMVYNLNKYIGYIKIHKIFIRAWRTKIEGEKDYFLVAKTRVIVENSVILLSMASLSILGIYTVISIPFRAMTEPLVDLFIVILSLVFPFFVFKLPGKKPLRSPEEIILLDDASDLRLLDNEKTKDLSEIISILATMEEGKFKRNIEMDATEELFVRLERDEYQKKQS